MIKSLKYSLKQACIQIFRNRGMSLASLFCITVMLLILGLFFFLTVNINFMTVQIEDQFDTIEVFLKDETSLQEASAISTSLKSMPEIEEIEYITKEKALEEFKVRWGDNSYLLDNLPKNPLPNSLRITLKDLRDGEYVAEVCRTFEGVEDVRFYQTEVNKILNISESLQKGALIVIVFLIIGSVVVVSNTVKLTVMARQDEIQNMRYVGATNWFIRGPMLLEGIIIGCISAAISVGLSALIYTRLCDTLGEQAFQLFSASLVDPQFLIKNIVWIFFALGIGIGAFGSIISMRRYLKS
jgi:cell division transport system permease protein